MSVMSACQYVSLVSNWACSTEATPGIMDGVSSKGSLPIFPNLAAANDVGDVSVSVCQYVSMSEGQLGPGFEAVPHRHCRFVTDRYARQVTVLAPLHRSVNGGSRRRSRLAGNRIDVSDVSVSVCQSCQRMTGRVPSSQGRCSPLLPFSNGPMHGQVTAFAPLHPSGNGGSGPAGSKEVSVMSACQYVSLVSNVSERPVLSGGSRSSPLVRLLTDRCPVR